MLVADKYIISRSYGILKLTQESRSLLYEEAKMKKSVHYSIL